VHKIPRAAIIGIADRYRVDQKGAEIMSNPSRSQRRKPIRTPGTGQRRPTPGAQQQRHVEPPDYSRDYADVRRDMRLITLISLLLFAGMVGVSFVL
jgi:hypothetical protein